MNTEIKNKKLGKGLATLIPNKSEENDSGLNIYQSNKMYMININDIISNESQPRKTFDQKSILELAESIQVHGLLQPIIVREKRDRKYEIIAGERRWRACKLAEIHEIPTIIKISNTRQNLEISIIENIQRCNLNVIEEAQAYQRLIDQLNYTHDDIAQRVNKSRSHISNLLRLLLLPENITSCLANDLITMGHARALINVSEKNLILEKIIKDNLSVRETEKLIKNISIKPIKQNKIEYQEDEMYDYRIKLEKTLSEKLGMPVSITKNKNYGNITIKFDDLSELEILIKKLTIV